MYKVSMHDLIAFKEALVKSNNVLRELYEAAPSQELLVLILKNKEEIIKITETYNIDDNLCSI